MYFWVITNGQNDTFDFHKVDAEDMVSAVESVEDAITTVSPFFKKNYPKYSKLWDKLNKKGDERD
jgi:hypothetical protein